MALNSASNGGIYGGGGAGAGINTVGSLFSGGAGSQGVIFIVYTPSVANGNFFFMFA